MKTILTAVLAGLILTGASAASAQSNLSGVEVASLATTTQKTGWLQVLSEGKPVKSAKKIPAVSRAPIARELVAFREKVAPGTIIVDNS